MHSSNINISARIDVVCTVYQHSVCQTVGITCCLPCAMICMPYTALCGLCLLLGVYQLYWGKLCYKFWAWKSNNSESEMEEKGETEGWQAEQSCFQIITFYILMIHPRTVYFSILVQPCSIHAFVDGLNNSGTYSNWPWWRTLVPGSKIDGEGICRGNPTSSYATKPTERNYVAATPKSLLGIFYWLRHEHEGNYTEPWGELLVWPWLTFEQGVCLD